MAKIDIENLIDTKEAAERLGVCLRRVQQFCESGRLGKFIGGRYLITADEVEKFAKVPRPAGNPEFVGGGQ